MSNLLPACRACLSVDVTLYDMKESLMTAAFETATGLSVTQYNRLPQYLCAYCCVIVRRCVNFRRQCYMSQDTMEALADSGKLTLEAIKLLNLKPDPQSSGSILDKSQHILPAMPHDEQNDSPVIIRVTIDEEFDGVDVKTEISDDTLFETTLESGEKLPETDTRHVENTSLMDIEKVEHIDELYTDQCDNTESYDVFKTKSVDEKHKATHMKTQAPVNAIDSNFKKTDHHEETAATNTRTMLTDKQIESTKDLTTAPKTIISSSDPTEHTETFVYECDTCGTAFSTRANIIKHMKSHNVKESRKSETPAKLFPRLSYMDIHKWLHTGEKQLKCDECGKSYSNINFLNEHKRVHADDKPFECATCGKSFVTNARLKIHRRVHK